MTHEVRGELGMNFNAAIAYRIGRLKFGHHALHHLLHRQKCLEPLPLQIEHRNPAAVWLKLHDVP